MKAEGGDVEAQKPAHVPHMRLVLERGYCPPEVINHHHNGSGTEEDPYVVEWIPDDPCNPMGFSLFKKWAITILVAVATLAVALTSSAYTGGIREMMMQFNVGTEVVTLGVALFVLGFAIGPLLWAPLSELFGRQVLFFFTYGALTAFCAGAAGSQNIQTLIILRFFAGAFGSSPLTNAGGVIADMFPAAQRGLALSIFAAAPFLGPTLGPIIGGFLGMNAGWRWVEGFLAIFSGVIWIICSVLVPETYAPVLLRHRAQNLSKMTGKVYRSKLEIERGPVKLSEALKTSLLRPWVLLLFEPIVLLLSIYMAIIYGTLYMMFGAFPIVYQEERHWNEGIGGLAFLGVMVGMLSAVFTSIFDNKRYVRAVKKHGGFAPPEERLPLCLIGGILIPIGLFWFAWTNSPHVHWMASIAAGVPFGFGMVFVFLSVFNYLIDSYTIFAASVLAANAVLRSLFGTAFPLFTTYMYHNLGIHWASSIPAFLAVACVPFPFLFYKYGAQIRARCKFAATSEAFMRKLRESQAPPVAEAEDDKSSSSSDVDDEGPSAAPGEHGTTTTTHEPLSRTQTKQSLRSIRTQNSLYEGNPYDIDRVNSRESFTKLPHQIQHDVSRPSTATGGEKPPLAHSPIPEHHEHESHKP